jgi:rhamnose transport system permease protein
VVVAAIGMTFVILARQIDVSIGSQFSVCAILAGLIAKGGVPMPAVALITLSIGCALGAVNGVLVAMLGLPSIVVTLATMIILQQSLIWGRQGASVQDLGPNFQWFGFSQAAGEWVLVGSAALATIIFATIARRFPAGRAVYAVGSDAEAARLAGVQPRRVVFFVFVLMGALTAAAALLNAVRFPQVDANANTGLELSVIAAVVVGGTAISGGRGTLIGSVIGVALLATIGPALVFLHLQAQWEKALQGAIILAAVASDRLFTRKT